MADDLAEFVALTEALFESGAVDSYRVLLARRELYSVRARRLSDEREASRRSIYTFIKRGLVVPMLESLDLADTVSSCPQRQVTTVAPQALTLFNGDFVNAQARHFAARLKRQAGDDAEKQITLAWRLALGREPSASELAQMKSFLQTEPLEQLCRVILNLNEFVYPE